MWHGCAKCLWHWPCMQECIDCCCFVLELAGVCRASENGDECGIKLEIIPLTWVLFACAVCPMPHLNPKGSNPVHPWEQNPWYIPYWDLARYNTTLLTKTAKENETYISVARCSVKTQSVSWQDVLTAVLLKTEDLFDVTLLMGKYKGCQKNVYTFYIITIAICSRTFAQKMALFKWMLASPCNRQDSQRNWWKHSCRLRSARP
jgi:hypothetical protein